MEWEEWGFLPSSLCRWHGLSLGAAILGGKELNQFHFQH